MPQMQTRSLFLPYFNAGERLGLALVSGQIDGRGVTLDWDRDQHTCDLSLTPEWKRCDLVFDVVLEPGAPPLPELVPSAERERPPLQLVTSLHCGDTLYRWQTDGAWDPVRGTGRISVPLNRDELHGAVEIRAFLARTRAQDVDSNVATAKGARVAYSSPWTIYVDPGVRRGGPGLETRWEDFAESPSIWRKGHPTLLFHLDTTGAVPILFLNSRIDPDLRAVMQDPAPRGKKARLRNLLFASIAISVWHTLLQTARLSIPSEGEPDEGWARNVLQFLAAELLPEKDDGEALAMLLRDLKDPNGGSGIDERIAGAIVRKAELRVHAEAMIAEGL